MHERVGVLKNITHHIIAVPIVLYYSLSFFLFLFRTDLNDLVIPFFSLLAVQGLHARQAKNEKWSLASIPVAKLFLHV